MLTSEKFEVTVEGYHSVYIPDIIAEPFANAGHKRVLVKASLRDKSHEFHGALQKIKGQYQIMFGKNNQKAIDLEPYESFYIQLVEDTSKYGVEMPEEFQAVLDSDPEAYELFEALTDGKKRGLIYTILRYKNSQTRIDKALILTENLKLGITDMKEIMKDRR
ncbi:YdeI/OmpD-associated family protein [Aureisphaera galaxeae]|uniref:YdeI/OmpD-associated family protein n=1 Tax=Aureisphaera galaxeae TaxID=1538023 RepID=UPI002350426B|nr:YdeI/OmpD-associated family protein [Aureisphaera galaxeae]MDC8003573.1 YdeI/OmpD-associated family protein [Aureisphaera galaxeae]